jgi:putative acetyltransferase
MVHVAESAADFAALLALLTEYEESLPIELRHAEFENDRTRLEGVYGPPNAAFLATVDGTSCGCVALIREDASTGVIKRLYVQPRFRTHGVGRALLGALLENARENGYERVVLDTHREQLAAAYRLYRAFGFVEREPFGDVDYECATFMELRL